MYKLLILPLAIMLVSCSSTNHEDIKKWMSEQSSKQKGRIKPLPPAKTFIPVPFIATSDPFKEKPILTLNAEQNKYAPNPDRRKEPLESYPLENLKMSGIMIKDKVTYALIITPEGTVHYITYNNYIGNNYGRVIKIDESQVVLDERVKNTSDEWEARNAVINLEDGSK
jgi:type IV pilus assembly protein PilP